MAVPSEQHQQVVSAVSTIVAQTYITAADPDELDVAAALKTVTPLIDALVLNESDRAEIAIMLTGAAVTFEALRPYLVRRDDPAAAIAAIAAKQLTERELAVLEALAETDATPGELENLLVVNDPGISAFAVSRALSRLRFAGLITEHRKERTSHIQTLTRQGRSVLSLLFNTEPGDEHSTRSTSIVSGGADAGTSVGQAGIEPASHRV